jgi:hypothetical protein
MDLFLKEEMYTATMWDPDNLRLSSDRVGQAKSKTRRRVKGRFLRGPVPMHWLSEAHKVGGKAGLMGLILWHLSGMNKNAVTVRVSNVEASRWGVDRFAKSRALKALAGAGLITVEQNGKQSPLVTILDISEQPSRLEEAA